MTSAFIVLNKSGGITSACAVNRVKRILCEKGVKIDKIGHFGTLDPDGEGILPLAINKATRLFGYLALKTKVYYTEFVFGRETDTLDAAGKTVATTTYVPDAAKIEAAVKALTGEIMQIPPAYSAKSVSGRRAYDLARAGEIFELKPQKVNISKIDMLGNPEKNTFAFRITCGGGTYIRSIARDMAYMCGSLGYMRLIRRERSGCFGLERAVSEEELRNCSEPEKYFFPPERALEEYPAYEMAGDAETARLIFNGVNLALSGMPEGIFRFYVEGELAGLGKKDDLGRFKWAVRLK